MPSALMIAVCGRIQRDGASRKASAGQRDGIIHLVVPGEEHHLIADYRPKSLFSSRVKIDLLSWAGGAGAGVRCGAGDALCLASAGTGDALCRVWAGAGFVWLKRAGFSERIFGKNWQRSL